MHLKITITKEGMERIAAEQPLYSWHFSVSMLEELPGEEAALELARNPAFLGIFDTTPPTREAAIPVALANMAQQERDLRDQLNQDLAQIEERRQNLLAISNA